MKRTADLAENDRRGAKLSAPVALLADGAGSDGATAPARFSILGYSGAPVEFYGWRFVISLSGMTAKPRFPVLREHERDRIVGMAEAWRVDENGFHVEGNFSGATPDGREALALAREGYPWEASIGVDPLKVLRLERGKKQTVNGRELEGPLDIWLESEVREVSFVSLGADRNTEARALASQTGSGSMNLRDILTGLGMPPEASDEEMQEFAARHLAQMAEDRNKKKGDDAGDDKSDNEGSGNAENASSSDSGDGGDGEDGGDEGKDLSAAVRAALAGERRRTAEINDLVYSMGLGAELSARLCREGATLDKARQVVLEELARGNGRINRMSLAEGESEGDKFRRMAAAGLALQLGERPEQGKAVPGAEEFAHMGPQQLARLCLERAGCNSVRMSKDEVARSIFSARLASSTSDFKAIFLDVANKTLLKAYQAQRPTWPTWTNTVSVADFRQVYGVQFSALGELELVRENEEYRNGSYADSMESYSVRKYGKIFDLSWEMLVNDDLNAFARLPRYFGAIAARKQASLVYDLLLANPKMSDGQNVFSARHGNLVSTGTALDGDSLDAAWQMMTTQRGPDGDFLDITPRILLVPPSLRTQALLLLNSTAMPVAQMNSGTYNVWQDAGLQLVVEPRLEPASGQPAPWFLLADPALINTMDVAFLDGKQTPDIIEHEEFRVDAISYKVRMVMGAGWVDYRGALKNPGVVKS